VFSQTRPGPPPGAAAFVGACVLALAEAVGADAGGATGVGVVAGVGAGLAGVVLNQVFTPWCPPASALLARRICVCAVVTLTCGTRRCACRSLGGT
jgi:hypothetical protein